MSALWRTARKWFAENLKGRFQRRWLCQMQYSLPWPQRPTSGSSDGLQVEEFPVFCKAPKTTTLGLHIVSSLQDHEIQEVRLACVQLGGTRDQRQFILACTCVCTQVHICVCVSLKHHLEASKLLFKPETQGRRCPLRTYIVSEEKKGEWNWGAREGWDSIRALLLHLNDLQAFKTTTGSASVAEWLAHSCQSVGRVRYQELLAYENSVVKTQLLRSVHPTRFSSCLAHFLLKDQGIQRLRRAESEQRRSRHQSINRRH